MQSRQSVYQALKATPIGIQPGGPIYTGPLFLSYPRYMAFTSLLCSMNNAALSVPYRRFIPRQFGRNWHPCLLQVQKKGHSYVDTLNQAGASRFIANATPTYCHNNSVVLVYSGERG
jgi:hypothetical protein